VEYQEVHRRKFELAIEMAEEAKLKVVPIK
jgi:hypothetical protein